MLAAGLAQRVFLPFTSTFKIRHSRERGSNMSTSARPRPGREAATWTVAAIVVVLYFWSPLVHLYVGMLIDVAIVIGLVAWAWTIAFTYRLKTDDE